MDTQIPDPAPIHPVGWIMTGHSTLLPVVAKGPAGYGVVYPNRRDEIVWFRHQDAGIRFQVVPPAPSKG